MIGIEEIIEMTEIEMIDVEEEITTDLEEKKEMMEVEEEDQSGRMLKIPDLVLLLTQL